MGVVVRLPQVVHVVRADERQPEIGGDGRQPAVDDPLVVDAVVLHLEEEIVRAEDVPERCRGLPRPIRSIPAEVGGDLSLEATAEPDEAVGVSGQELLVDARLGVETFRVPGGDELDEVVVARPIGREQHEVVGGLSGDAAAAQAASVGDVHLASEDRLDPACSRLVVERDRGEEVAVLGDCHRGHPERLYLVQHLADAARTVEERELRVQVQVHELGGVAHRLLLPRYSHSIVAGGFELMS